MSPISSIRKEALQNRLLIGIDLSRRNLMVRVELGIYLIRVGGNLMVLVELGIDFDLGRGKLDGSC